MVLSLRPSTYVEGGGLLDDVDVDVKEARFTLFDYNGTLQQPVPALAMILVTADGTEQVQNWTAGDSKYFVPSDDGLSLIPVGDKESLVNSTNLAKFLESLVNCGFDESLLDSGDIRVLEGMNIHVQQVAQQRKGLIVTSSKTGQEKKNSGVLLVTKINRMPGEKVAGKPGVKTAAKQVTGKNAAATTATKTNGAAAATGMEDSELAEYVVTILAEQGGTITKAKLLPMIMKAVPEADRKAAVSRVTQPDFLSNTDLGWTFDGAALTLG